MSHFIKNFNYNNNLIGSVNLINVAVNYGIKCFVFTSSIAVYGANQLPMRDDLVPMPEDSYGVAKYAVELELKNSKEMFGLNYIIFRPHNVYGERQNLGDRYRNVLGIFMNQIMQGLPITIFGDGNQERAFSYIGDVAPIIAKSIFEPNAYNEIFNIGADEPFTVSKLAELIFKAMNVEPNIQHLPARNEVKIAYADHRKVKDILKYSANISLERGISKMAEWAKIAGVKKSKKFENIEIMKKLPAIWLE